MDFIGKPESVRKIILLVVRCTIRKFLFVQLVDRIDFNIACSLSRTYTNMIIIKARCSFRLILVVGVITNPCTHLSIYLSYTLYVCVPLPPPPKNVASRRHISCKLSSLVMVTVFERLPWIIRRHGVVVVCVAYGDVEMG